MVTALFRRALWLVIGAGFGFGMSFWSLRALRRVARRRLPDRLLVRVDQALDALDGGSGFAGPAIAVQSAGARYRPR